MAARRLYLEGEKACDDSVLQSGVPASEYASLLLEIASMLSTRAAVVSPVTAMARRSQLRGRVVAILGDRDRRPVTRAHALAFAGLAAALLVPLATASLSISAETTPRSPRQNASAERGASAGIVPEESEAASVDRYGDPIPGGATGVLGTFRLRQPGWHKRLAFSADGTKLVTAAEFGVRVWRTATGELLWGRAGTRKTPPPWGSLERVSVSSDGNVAAIVRRDVTGSMRKEYSAVLLRASGEGQPMPPLELAGSETGEYSRLCFAPDGTRLFIAHRDGAIQVWDVHRSEQVGSCRLSATNGGLSILEVSPDGKLLGVVFGNRFYVWPWSSDNTPTPLDLEGFRGRAIRLAFSGDGKRVAIGHGDPTGIRVWDLRSGQLLEDLTGPSIGIYTGGVAFTDDGIRLATPGVADQVVSVWDMNRGQRVRQFDTEPFQPERVAISPDGQWIAAAPRIAARIRVWNVETGTEVARNAVGHQDAVNDLRFSPDGSRIITASDDGTVRTWHGAQRQLEHVLRHDYIVRGVAVSPDGKRIASSSNDNTVRLWDSTTGRELCRFEGHGRMGGVRPVAFSSDGQRLHTWGDDDMKLRVWDETGKTVHQWDVPPAELREQQVPPELASLPSTDSRRRLFLFGASGFSRAQFSPEGDLFVLVLRLGVYLFDVDTGKQIAVLPAQGILRSAAVAPSANGLAVAEDRRSMSPTVVSLYWLTSEKRVWETKLQDNGPAIVRFSPDGRLIAAANRQPGGKIEILDAATGATLRTIDIGLMDAHEKSLRFSPDGKSLACATAEGAVLLWDLAPLGLRSR
jgi:WD40 repeat protein